MLKFLSDGVGGEDNRIYKTVLVLTWTVHYERGLALIFNVFPLLSLNFYLFIIFSNYTCNGPLTLKWKLWMLTKWWWFCHKRGFIEYLAHIWSSFSKTRFFFKLISTTFYGRLNMGIVWINMFIHSLMD